MRDLFRTRRMWRKPGELRDSYDVVIIGGGAHGLATAYYLGQLGVKNVAVLEQNYIGSGAAGRNTTILRSNYKTPEGARFYDASVKMYEQLGAELDFNLLFSQCGHLTLAHSDRAMFVMANRAEVNRTYGIDSQLVDADEVKRLCPQINVSDDVTYPIMGALYHPPGGIIRHDAVVWGYARGADRHGVEIHPVHRGDRDRALERHGHRGQDEPRHDQGRSGDQRDRRLEHADVRDGRASSCRSPPTSSRRASPSRSSHCSTSSSSPRRCTSTSRSPIAASSSWGPRSSRGRRIG